MSAMLTWLSRLLGSAPEEPAAAVSSSQSLSGASSIASPDPTALARLQRILDQSGVQLERKSLELLLVELQRDRKIEAIKRIRTEGRPRLGLKEAKDIVDSF